MNAQTKAKQDKIAKLLKFARGGKTSEEISSHMNIPKSTLGNLLAELQMSGELYKVIPEVEHFKGMGGVPCWFTTTGTECHRTPPVILPKDVHDPAWNHEFIAVMHTVLQARAA